MKGQEPDSWRRCWKGKEMNIAGGGPKMAHVFHMMTNLLPWLVVVGRSDWDLCLIVTADAEQRSEMMAVCIVLVISYRDLLWFMEHISTKPTGKDHEMMSPRGGQCGVSIYLALLKHDDKHRVFVLFMALGKAH